MGKRMNDESRSKLAGAELERVRLQETSRYDITRGSQVVAQQQRRIETLERDVARVKTLLIESEQNLNWMRGEIDYDGHDGVLALQQLEDEVRATTTTLELARRDEAVISQQAETQRLRNEQERIQLQKRLEGALSPIAVKAT